MKNIKIVVILLVVAMILSFGFYFFFKDLTPEPEEEIAEEEIRLVLTRDSHLFRAGTDGELGVRRDREEVAVFNPGDYFGISGNYKGEKEARIVANILDESGDILNGKERVLSLSLYETDERGSNFSMCCALVPDNEGSYHVELLTGGERLTLLPFDIFENKKDNNQAF